MGLRFRKSLNLGSGFRVNLSKSGVGYSWGTKGFRKTKMANGKTRDTYSVPGTGLSYVNEKGKPKSTYENTTNYDENNFSNSNNKNIGYFIKSFFIKMGILIGGLLVFSILLAYFPIGLIICSVGSIIYFLTHRQAFSEKSLIKKIGISTLLFFMILFGMAGNSVKPSDRPLDTSSNIKEEFMKEAANNSDINNELIASVSDGILESTSDQDAIEQQSITKKTQIEETPPKITENPVDQQAPAAIIVPIVNTSEPRQEPTEVEPPATETPTAKEVAVYITNTGEKYHRSSCRYLDESKYETTLTKARSQGYVACKVCKPPTQ